MRINTLFLSLFLCVVGFSQPANDDCANAISIVVGAGCTVGDVTSATTEGLGTPSCWNGPPSNYSTSVWYSFVATDDSITLNFGDGTLGANVLMAAYSGTCGTLSEIGCTKGGEIDLTGLDDVSPQTYYILVDGQGANEGTFCISAYETPPPPPPIGTCENPRDLQVDGDCNNISGTQYAGQNNIILTDIATGGDAGGDATGYGNPQGLESSCGGTSATDDAYWVRFEATGTSHTFANEGPDDLDYTVYSGADCSSLTEQSCTTIGGTSSSSIGGFTDGQIYYVMITNASGGTSTQRYLCITGTNYTNPYDDCGSALTITENVIYENLNNAGASDDGGTGDLCSGSVENSVWMVWTTPGDWTGDAYVHLYNQDCACENGLQMAVHSANASCPGNSPTCEVNLNPNNNNDFFGQFTPTPGSTYYIAVDGYAACACVFDFSITNSSETPTLSFNMISFDGKAFEGYNLLTWKTIEQFESDKFHLMKSPDSKKWEILSTIQSKSSLSGEYSNYQFKDKDPYEKTYYKLKEVNLEGSVSYSRVIQIDNVINTIEMYPTISERGGAVYFNTDEFPSSVSLVGMAGNVWELNLNDNRTIILPDELERGMYFVSFSFDNGVPVTKKIIIQ